MNKIKALILPFFLFNTVSFLLICISFHALSQNIKGIVINQKTKNPIPYVSISIKNKPFGTISDSLGRFNLLQHYDNVSDKDSIIFSSIGYESFRTLWKSFKDNPKKIILNPVRRELEPVSVSAKQHKIKTYGKGRARIILSPKGYKSMPQQSSEKGREQVSILKIDKDIILRQLTLLVWRRSRLEHITFRMNIYDVKNGVPNNNILKKDIIFTLQGIRRTGMSDLPKVDLTPYRIHLKGLKEIALGLEILDDEPIERDTSQTAFYIPSYPSPFHSSFYRLNRQSPWMKVNNSYLIASLEAAVLKKGDYVEEAEDNVTKEIEFVMRTAVGAKMLYGNNINAGRKIKLQDAEIYYETYGEGEPLLLLHGNNEGINSFREQIRPISKHFKVIAVDTRGQANSTNTFKGGYTYELFASDMKQLLDSLHLKKVNILGWSDGGNTGLIMAVKYPDYVKRLAIMGANAFSGEEAIDTAVIKIFEERSRKYSNKTDKESLNQKKLADLVLSEPHLTAGELQTIQSPVLVMAGENDVIKKEHTLFIHKNIPHSKLKIIEGSDHYAPLKNRKTFNKIIMEFFRKELN